MPLEWSPLISVPAVCFSHPALLRSADSLLGLVAFAAMIVSSRSSSSIAEVPATGRAVAVEVIPETAVRPHQQQQGQLVVLARSARLHARLSHSQGDFPRRL